jgi:hypothetical protein
VIGGQVGVPGITSELTGVNATSGKATGKLTLTAQLGIGPTFVPAAGVDGLPAIVAITGGSTSPWTVLVAMPAPEEPPAAVPK